MNEYKKDDKAFVRSIGDEVTIVEKHESKNSYFVSLSNGRIVSFSECDLTKIKGG